MNTPKKSRLFSLITMIGALLLLIATPAFSEDASIGKQVATIEVPAQMTVEIVKGCVLKALVQRKWTLKEKSNSSAVGYYVNGKNEATVTVKFDTKEVVIFCVGHTRRADELPMRWIEGLKKDIQAFLNQEFAKI